MLYESQRGSLTMALTGETLLTRSVARFREPRFLNLVDLLRKAEVTFTNAEMLFHDYEGVPCEEIPATYMRCDPRLLEDLKWMGFNMVGCAMNHAFDYMDTGVLVNKANLDRHGLVNAGTGRNSTLARAPAYLDTTGGRVALLAATDHVNVPAGRAGDDRPEVRGRPGANVIRTQTVYTVDRETFRQLRTLDDKLGFALARSVNKGYRFRGRLDLETESQFFFGPGDESPSVSVPLFRLGDTNSRTTIANADDWAENLKWIRDARRMADWVLFSFHCGFHGLTADDPPDHMIKLAHEAIDSGVDVVVGHGPHRDRGIEIYRGKPIFYSLGDFILQNDTPLFPPADAYASYGLGTGHTPADFYFKRSQNESVAQDITPEWWQSALAVLTWKDHRLQEIRLHPVNLGMGLPIGQRGRPVLATEPVGDEVLGRFQRSSDRFHTTISNRDGVGVIEVA